MKTYNLSSSTLNLYAECRRCFWDNLHERKRPREPFPSLPSGMDKVIKQRFDDYRSRGEIPAELSELEGISLFNDKQLLALWRSQRKGLQWQNKSGHILEGSLDDVLVEDATQKLIVLDYKTRGFPLKEVPNYYRLQLECYTFLLQKNGFPTTDYAFLLFYYPGKFQEDGNLQLNHQLVKMPVSVKNAQKVFTNAIKVVKGNRPAANRDCDFCR